MPSNIENVLGSYDIFAKSFPGTIFVIGFISLLPVSEGLEILPDSLWALAILVTGILLLGFAFGQAIHSVAVKIENYVYGLLSGYYHTIQSILGFLLGMLGRKERDSVEDRFDNLTESDLQNLSFAEMLWKELGVFGVLRITVPVAGLIYYGYSSGNWHFFIIWIIGVVLGPTIIFLTPRVTNWAKAVLTPHRKMFLRDRLGQVDSPKESLLVKSFEGKFTERMDLEQINWESNSDREDVYKLVMSYLEFKESGRANQFQAILSFNRSMWVTFSVYSFLYFLLYLEMDIIGFYDGNSSVIVEVFGNGATLLTITMSLVIGAVLFMEGEKQYKLLFVDYLMADFLTSTDANLG